MSSSVGSTRLSHTALLFVAVSLAICGPSFASAQASASPRPKTGGSANVKLLGHLAFNGRFTTSGLDIEQEPSRPYAYVDGFADEPGFYVIDLADPTKPRVIYHWQMPMSPEDKGLSGENGRVFKLDGRYYFAKTVQWNPGSPHDTLGLIVFDVTGLPDPATVKEVAHIGAIGARVVHVFPYMHSDGKLYLITTPTVGAYAQIYDARKLLSHGAKEALVGTVPVPSEVNLKTFTRGYHDTYAQYDVTAKQDKLYTAGTGGGHVWDITHPETPRYLFSMTGGDGLVTGFHTVIPTPDSKYAVATIERPYRPMFIYDLEPGNSGKSKALNAIGAWTADWRDTPHQMVVRWPYVFVAAYEDGLQIVNMIDPKEPKTEGWYYTCMCSHLTGWSGSPTELGTSFENGAGDINVRNSDGLIVVSDYTTGLWTFRMDGFNGWNGRQWRMPNYSTDQDWKNGPLGPRKP